MKLPRFARSSRLLLGLVFAVLPTVGCHSNPPTAEPARMAAAPLSQPFVVVLGIAQDGGIPQPGSYGHPAWEDPSLRRRVVSLGLVDPHSGKRWLFEATPDFPRQLHHLQRVAADRNPGDGAAEGRPVPDGIFLTHAHMGHYSGLLFLGHEAMGARNVPVYAMPRMADFLRSNGPWSQLVSYENIELRPLATERPESLTDDLRVTPMLVPHRQEYSEVVGFRIDGPERSVLFLPDIDSWEEWDDAGVRIEDVLATVDLAYLDATFYAEGEIPGRDMSGFPHPFIVHSMERFAALPPEERAKVRFIHLNHTNPAQYETSDARDTLERAGFRVARRGEVVRLGKSPRE